MNISTWSSEFVKFSSYGYNTTVLKQWFYVTLENLVNTLADLISFFWISPG